MRWQRLITMASERLAAHGVASPRLDARLLAQHLTGYDQLGLLTAPEPDSDQIDAYALLIARRAQHEPLQLITGWAPFRGLRIEVGEGVFIPRPETELVAQAGLDALAGRDRVARVVELCAGSGAISAAILAEHPDVELWAVEKYRAAAVWTRRAVESRGGTVVLADMAEALHELDGTVDVVVANPPYIPTPQMGLLPPEVAEHDPPTALFAADDGLADIRVVLSVAHRLLAPEGVVVVEHGDDQQPRVVEMAVESGFVEVSGHDDLAGRPRYVRARRMSVLGG